MSAFGGKADLNMTGRDFRFCTHLRLRPVSTAQLPSGTQAGRAITPAQVRNVDLGQHYAELPAKHEICERSINVCREGKAK
jgi:hypothetical protein